MDNKEFRHLGGKNVSADRVKRDFYPTPASGTLALLDHLDLYDRVWEPACGDGSMARVLGERYHVMSSDIQPRGFGRKRDFLSGSIPPRVRSIVTNPPFYLGREFIECALEHRQVRTVAMLLRFTVLAGNVAWVNLFKEKKPSHIIALQHRLPYLKGGKWSPGVFSHAWVVWHDHNSRLPVNYDTQFIWSDRRHK